MAIRHDEFGNITEAQLRASAKYRRKCIQQRAFVLNVNTDMDIINRLNALGGEPVNAYLKRLIRSDIASRSVV